MLFSFALFFLRECALHTTRTRGVDSGGGVQLADVQGENGARLANCEILSNTTSGAGGGIRLNNLDTKVTLVDCVIGENSAEVGGGVNSFDTRQVTLQNVAVYNNSATLLF